MRRAGVLRLAIAIAFTASVAWAEEPVVKFEVPQPFRVGNHSYAAGTISVHAFRDYNPTTSLLEVRVNGDCIGMIAARRGTDVRAVRNEALFQRDADGRLVMVGYRTAGRTAGSTFRFEERAPAQGSAPTASLIGAY